MGVTWRQISLRGVAVHNLKDVDLDLPHRKLIAICGLSGSGKTSLALDTLYAEGQRRYIDSFSVYTRQFLQRLEKPEADSIEGIPPAIAVTHKNASRSNRATVGTVTEIVDHLRLLFAKIGRLYCRQCHVELQVDTPQSAAEVVQSWNAGTRFLVTYPLLVPAGEETSVLWQSLRESGFLRVIANSKTWNLADSVPAMPVEGKIHVVVDRLTVEQHVGSRLRDSLESAFHVGSGRIVVFYDASDSVRQAQSAKIDDKDWNYRSFSTALRCEACGIDYPAPEPRLFSFNSPLGACPECEGFGNVVDLDMERIVPNARLSIREGAIAPWNTPAYAHELEELMALASDYRIPVDVPFSQLSEEVRCLISEGVPERNFGGLRGFFKWLERRKYKMHLRVFLSRWRSYRLCPACKGTRLRHDALAWRIGGKNIGDLSKLSIDEAAAFFAILHLEDFEQKIAHVMLDQVKSRLGYLASVGLNYITLDRPIKTLSGGELARVALTSALGSSLVNMLYVLDEPSVGLHPSDVTRLVDSITGLRDRGNTVVVVEHEEVILRQADQLIEIGPGAGERGGEVVFQGTLAEMLDDPRSLTGDFLSGRRGVGGKTERRTPNHGWIKLTGARGNNLKNIDVEFPLGVLCLVTGVSGAGKSTLVEDTLYPALCKRFKKETTNSAQYTDIFGDGQLEDVIMVDQSPIGRSPRSNPVTYIKAFDEIREVFAETIEAKTRNFTAGHFSFNVDGGRCTACEGDGYQQIDMQFLADVYMKCPQCQGRRYRPETLDIKYRGRNISEVLDLTVREAFTFFRGRPKVQGKLKRLIDVGLDYLRLGQGANTLSGGESQRLKLALYMAQVRKGRTLFLLDEPTTGLHFQDVVQLLDCFDALLAVGHSLIIVEHNLQMLRAADYLIDLGPGAGGAGGQIVAEGTPEEISRVKASATGQVLAQHLSVSKQTS